jgi:hypothetical protein
MELLTPPAIYSIVNYTIIHVFELPTLFGWGVGAPNQLLDRLASTKFWFARQPGVSETDPHNPISG